MHEILLYLQSTAVIITFWNFQNVLEQVQFPTSKTEKLQYNLRNRLVPKPLFTNETLTRAFKKNAKADVKMF